MGQPLLEFHRVSFERDEQPILTEVSLTIHQAEIVGVVFQGGTGKTELLYLGAGLLDATAGEVMYRGKRLRDQESQPPSMGFVFEDDGGLFENLTLYENIALPLRFHSSKTEEEIDAKVREILSVVSMEDTASKYSYEFGRDRQRVAALARALVYEPDIVFVDDFFIGADADAFHRMEETIALARDAFQTAFLLVMEATPDNFGVADRLCLVDHGAVLELDRTSMLG